MSTLDGTFGEAVAWMTGFYSGLAATVKAPRRLPAEVMDWIGFYEYLGAVLEEAETDRFVRYRVLRARHVDDRSALLHLGKLYESFMQRPKSERHAACQAISAGIRRGSGPVGKFYRGLAAWLDRLADAMEKRGGKQ